MPFNISPTQAAFNARGDGKFNKPFIEQVDFLRQKLNLPTEHYDDILKSAHDRAFVVAGATKADLLADFHDAINKAVLEGKSIQWFKKEFESIVQKHGWEGWTGSDTKAGRDWRARIIYKTNLSASYAAGRYAQLTHPDLLKSRPYWKYIHNDTVAHPRPLHVAWSGLVLRWDDPFWQTHFPPNGWGCRCRITAVSAKDYEGAQAPDEGVSIYKDRAGNNHVIPKGIDYGWDYAPGASVKTSLKDIIDQKLISMPPAISADMWQAVKPGLVAEHTKAVRDMVAVAAASMEPAGVGVIAHVMEPITIAALEAYGVDLQDSAVWLRDGELIHAIRDTKVDRGAAIPLDVWLNLPKYLDGAKAYFDNEDAALLYVFDVPGETGKVVIRLNRLEKVRENGIRKKIVSNFIATGGVIEAGNLSGSRYLSLEGKP